MKELLEKGKKAREAALFLAQVSTSDKDQVLNGVAEALIDSAKEILSANETDMANAKEAGLKGAIMDRLLLTSDRIASMADGLKQIAMLEDPVGEVHQGDHRQRCRSFPGRQPGDSALKNPGPCGLWYHMLQYHHGGDTYQ